MPEVSTSLAPIERIPSSQLGAVVKYGQKVTLKSVTTGKFVGTVDGVLQATFNKVESEDIFVIEANYHQDLSGLEINSGDGVVLTTSVGNRVTVQGDSHPTLPEAEPNTVHAYWDHMGDWQDLQIEKYPVGKIRIGDEVSFRGHQGKLISVVGNGLDATKKGWDISMNFILQVQVADPASALFQFRASASRRRRRQITTDAVRLVPN